MKTIIIIICIVCFFVFAYFFPKGVKILGIPAETFFQKNNSDEKDAD